MGSEEGTPRSNTLTSQHTDTEAGQQPLDYPSLGPSAAPAMTASALTTQLSAGVPSTLGTSEACRTQHDGTEVGEGDKEIPNHGSSESGGHRAGTDSALGPRGSLTMLLPGTELGDNSEEDLSAAEGIHGTAANPMPSGGIAAGVSASTDAALEISADDSCSMSDPSVNLRPHATEPVVFGPELLPSGVPPPRASVVHELMALPAPDEQPALSYPPASKAASATLHGVSSFTLESVAIMEKLIEFIKVHLHPPGGIVEGLAAADPKRVLGVLTLQCDFDGWFCVRS